jgi:hypothetical protein
MYMNKNLLIASMIMVALFLSACQITVRNPQEPTQNAITVNGMAQFKVAPDESVVMLRVETNGTTAKEAQDKNSAAMTAVQDALRKAGVTTAQLQTLNYNLYQNTYWDQKEQRMVTEGFKVSHTLQIKTTQLEQVGTYIQIGVDAGATGIDGVTYSLSDEKSREAKQEALRQAVQDARQKAEALADGLDMKLGKVSSVSINEYNVIPILRGVAMAEGMMDKGMPPPVTPQDVDVSANVQVVFEIA